MTEIASEHPDYDGTLLGRFGGERPPAAQWFADALAKGATLACGGGTPTVATNRLHLERHFHTVYLDVPAAIARERIGSGQGRPLAGDTTLHTRRQPVYRASRTTVRVVGASGRSTSTWSRSSPASTGANATSLPANHSTQ